MARRCWNGISFRVIKTMAQGRCPEEVVEGRSGHGSSTGGRGGEPGAEAAWLAGTGRGRRRARPEPNIPSHTKRNTVDTKLRNSPIYAKLSKDKKKFMAEHRNPVPTVDIIIEMEDDGRREGIVLIERKNPPHGWALPGGFVDYGESLEEAAVREAKEETSLDIELVRQFHTYSDPRRDPRGHTITTVFIARAAGTPGPGQRPRDRRFYPG